MSQNLQNKQNIRRVILLLISAILLASCEKEIEFKGEQIDPKLVINSIVEPGQPVKAYISKSIFFLDNDSNMQAPDDVVATLYVNGNRIGELTRQPDTIWTGYEYVDMDSVKPAYKIVPAFVSEYCPNEGDVVKITASANGFDDVEATTSPLPNAVACSVTDSKISYWESYYSTNYDEFGNETDSTFHIYCEMELTIEITDPNPGQTDFFRLRAKSGSYDDADMNYLSYFAQYDDPVFNPLGISDNDYFDFSDFNISPQGVFTDLLFDGKTYQIKMPFNVSMNKNEGADPDFFRIVLVMEHLGKEYYNYLSTCEQGSEIDQFFAEPVQTYTNVNGGYGIVAAHTVDTVWMELPLREQ